MDSLDLFKAVCRKKSCTFVYDGILESSTVRLEVPDLSQCHFSVLGDWGPTYRLDLRGEIPIKIELKRGAAWEVFEARPKSLAFESHRDPDVRQQTPLFTRIPWIEKDLFINVYYDQTGEIHFSQLSPVRPQKLWDKIIVRA